MMGCNKKVHFTANDLIGKVAVENVEIPSTYYIDSTKTWFEPGNKYRRTEGIYIQTEGPYEVRNDTLEIHYACKEVCDNTACGIQQYILKKDGKLHLVFMRNSDGEVENLSDSPFDPELELRGD